MIKINNTSKKFKNKILFLLIFCFIFLTSINICLAEEATPAPASANEEVNSSLKFTPEVNIPGFPEDATINGALLGRVINGFYNYIVWLAGILAVIVIMIAGFQWVTAAGNQSKIGEAKERITGAIIGLVLALSSYMLLNIINPELVKIQDLSELVRIAPMERGFEYRCVEEGFTCENTNPKANTYPLYTCSIEGLGEPITCISDPYTKLVCCGNFPELSAYGPEGTKYAWACLPENFTCETSDPPGMETYHLAVCIEKIGRSESCQPVNGHNRIKWCCGLPPREGYGTSF